MFEAMDAALKATYKALEPSDEEIELPDDEQVNEEDVMFWPDGAKTSNRELDEELNAGT